MTKESRNEGANACFDKAIANGRLSAEPEALNYVGNYMYMGTEGGRDLFKHNMTREYLEDATIFYIMVKRFDMAGAGLSVHRLRAPSQRVAYERAEDEHDGNMSQIWVFAEVDFWQVFSAIDTAMVHFDEASGGNPCGICKAPAEYDLFFTADRDGGAYSHVCEEHLKALQAMEEPNFDELDEEING